MTAKTIAVHGATGSQGAPVVTALDAAGHSVRPLSRATGADLFDRGSLEAAYRGADAVVLQLPLVYDERALVLAENAARAAEAAGVEHLLVNAGCILPPAEIGVPFLDARHRAATADVPRVTVLQPTNYMENLNGPWNADGVVRDGVIAYPVPAEAPMYWVAVDDVAGTVERAIALEVAGWFALPGEPATGHEVAELLGAALGRRMRWETISPETWGDRLRPYLGDHAADGTAAVYRMAAASPPPPAPDPAPAQEALGWSPRDVAAWALEASWPISQALLR
jgi:uncharacterized protein YbjT (DUF2867 family)